jgi:hypothetical protein
MQLGISVDHNAQNGRLTFVTNMPSKAINYLHFTFS